MLAFYLDFVVLNTRKAMLLLMPVRFRFANPVRVFNPHDVVVGLAPLLLRRDALLWLLFLLFFAA